LGAQGQLWSEYFPNTKHVEYMAFPRLAALAEAVWTAPARKSYADFLSRMPVELARLDVLDVAYRPLNPPGDAVSPSPVRVGPKGGQGRPRGR
jgi:hexosaminidase